MYQKQPGIDDVRVPKDKLLTQLQENRDAHRSLFEEAMEGYKVESIKILEDHIDRIKGNEPKKVAVSLPLPEDHTDDYNRVIQMVEWSMDDEVWLTGYEFDQYIRDNWAWKEQFLTTASHYGATT